MRNEQLKFQNEVLPTLTGLHSFQVSILEVGEESVNNLESMSLILGNGLFGLNETGLGVGFRIFAGGMLLVVLVAVLVRILVGNMGIEDKGN